MTKIPLNPKNYQNTPETLKLPKYPLKLKNDKKIPSKPKTWPKYHSKPKNYQNNPKPKNDQSTL